ncbi:MAG TPA: glycosyltransferase family 4 protein [Tepidisphaeraceae bacterium]|nr:glycosyltransferase family 4 protein [Tepidisphaeraceae bacterium]
MRIGLVSYEYPPQQGLGGVGTYMFRLASTLGRAGHEVHVIAGPSDRAPIPQHNVHLHRIPARFEIRSENTALRWLYWQGMARFMAWMHPLIWHWIKWDLAVFDALRELDAAHPLDLVECPEHAANGWMAGKLHRWPIVMRMHCPWELFVRINRFPFNPMHRVLAALERRTARCYADAVTVPSRAMKNVVDRTWDLRRPPIVFPNFMDFPEERHPMPPENGQPHIVCVGRIEPLKGQDTLAQAFSLIARKYPAARLVIVGPDRWPGKRSFAQLLPRLVPDPEIRSRIDLPGAVPLEKVSNMLRAARVAVVSSRGFESFSFAALESLAAGRPVVATATGALPEIVEHEQTGLIVPASDPRSMADALDRMLSDRTYAERMAAGGFETARARCHTPRVLPQIMSSYDEATSFFCQVKAARSERTARSWRDAIDSARKQLLGEVEQAVDEAPRDEDSAVHPMPTAARRRLDVA